MRKNIVGQVVSAHLVSKTDGSDVTSGTTTVYITGDNGTQASGGTATHKGNGEWTFAPTAANTNYNHVTFTFVNTSAVSVGVQLYPVSYDPTDGASLGLTVLSGITSLGNWLRAFVRKDAADSTAKTEINTGGGAYNEATDSQEGIRDTEPLGTAMRGTDGANTTTPPTAIENADVLLDRDMATGTDSGGRTVRNALRPTRNRWTVVSGNLTVYKEDDTTVAWTAPVSSDDQADPITGIDPT